MWEKSQARERNREAEEACMILRSAKIGDFHTRTEGEGRQHQQEEKRWAKDEKTGQCTDVARGATGLTVNI